MSGIYANLAAATAQSDAIAGGELIGGQGGNNLQAVSAVVARVADAGDYEVQLQSTGLWIDGTELGWKVVATFTQAEDAQSQVLTIGGALRYRFEHQSGVEVRAVLA